jgi:hypothetical protein
MVTVPLWGLFGLVVLLAVVFREVRVWLAVAAVLFGAYLASTGIGQSAKDTVDRITHPSTSITTTRH